VSYVTAQPQTLSAGKDGENAATRQISRDKEMGTGTFAVKLVAIAVVSVEATLTE
jgi:hypothetical protein